MVTPRGLATTSFRAMGTTVSLLLPEARAEEGTAVVWALFLEWEAALSRFRPESELSRLNARAGEPVAASPLLRRVLAAALDAARATDGVYDPTLGGQIARLGYDRTFEEIERLTAEDAETAEKKDITTEITEDIESRGEQSVTAEDQSARDSALRPGGAWREIALDAAAGTVALPRGAALDFGGIAKGMAVDAAIEALRERGFHTALVNAGGDLAALGLPPGERQWSIAVPGRDGHWKIPLVAGAVATSGIAKRHWTQHSEARHHLLDPRTGLPAQTGLWSVTVAAGRCAQAEVAAKVAFVLGRREGAAFLRRHGLAGLLVGAEGLWSAEGGWPALEMEVTP